MKYFSLFKTLCFSSAFLLMLGINVNAQQQGTPPQAQASEVNENFTDDEYRSFAKINLELIPLQESAQDQMVKAIEDEGLEVERFQELAQAQQNGSLKDVSNDVEELAKFNEAGQKVMEMQHEIQTQVQEVISNSDLSAEKFQEMYMAYNQSETVRSKVDEMIQEQIDN